jgi:predicted nucleic acid-binding protein
MPNNVIADTSCFIILSKINEVNLLQEVYGEVYTNIRN